MRLEDRGADTYDETRAGGRWRWASRLSTIVLLLILLITMITAVRNYLYEVSPYDSDARGLDYTLNPDGTLTAAITTRPSLSLVYPALAIIGAAAWVVVDRGKSRARSRYDSSIMQDAVEEDGPGTAEIQ